MTPPAQRMAEPFISPEDFDVTGVLAGMDCSESHYWWVPELHASVASAASPRLAMEIGGGGPRQAAARPTDVANAAA